jgi:glycine/D-amino acid oxidase-like deaminating enzyme
MRRRTFLSSLLTVPLAGLFAGRAAARKVDRPRIVVVGAGAFGGWTALNLLRNGARVTLVDAWGAGNNRSSSGGESRVIRQGYSDPLYVRLAQRSLALWRKASAAWDRPIFHESGVLFMRREGHGESFFETALGNLDDAGVPCERLTGEELAARFPQLDGDGLAEGFIEPTAGYLLARRACEAVLAQFVELGGEYRMGEVSPGPIRAGEMAAATLSDGTRLEADGFVFACGPWLGTLFPESLGSFLTVSRQEVYYFGTPAGGRQFAPPALPVWADFGERIWYGIPGGERRGFKIADDTRGPVIDPTDDQRRISDAGLAAARRFLAERFPGLRDAPLVEGRVCQYTNTPDGDFIVDRHPEAHNVWLLGGGSGHGFKHGPALGELVADQVMGHRPPEPAFALARFDR